MHHRYQLTHSVQTSKAYFAQPEVDYTQGVHNRLQNEKSRLATAITACETATASISRPSSPMDSEHGNEATQRENDAKIKLEDLIDQVGALISI